MGRSRNKKMVAIYLDKEDIENLNKVAKEEGLSRSMLMRKLLKHYVKRHLKNSS